MASKQQRRQEKRRERQKQKRTAAQVTRRARTARGRVPVAGAAAWPVADAWISEHWHTWEAVVHAVLVRAHADGTRAFAAFEVDLGAEGLRRAEVQVGVTEGHVHAAAAARSQEHALVHAEPEAVARLVHEGLAFRRARGLPDPAHLDDAVALLAHLDPDDGPLEFRFGHEEEEQETEEIAPPQGIIGRVLGWIGRG